MTYKSKYMQSKATEQTGGFKSSYMQNKAAAKQQNNVAALPLNGGGAVAAQRSLDQIKTELTAAQSAEKSAMGKIDEYMLTYSGALDLRDPAELEALKNTATAATKERERLEQEYNAHSGAYEDKFGGMGDVGKAVTSVIGKPFLAVDALAETAKNAAQGKEMDMDSLAMQRYAQIGKLREDALSETSGAGRLLAETGLSVADNLYSRLLSAGTSGGALLSMGVSSAADKAHELGEQGESATRALVRGAVSGGIEAATEKLPLDTLADLVKTGGKGVIKNLLKQGGVEASEEGVAYALNWAADKLAKDPNAKWDWNEFAASVAGGGVSGLFFGLGGTAVNRVNSGAMPGSGLDGAPTARDGTLPFNAKLAEENIKAKTLPVETVVEEVKTETAQGGYEYAAINRVLEEGKVNNTDANTIIDNPELADAFTAITGVELAGTREQKRGIIRDTIQNRIALAQENELLAMQAAQQAEQDYNREQTENTVRESGYRSYVRGLFANGTTVADAKEILGTPELKAEWEAITGKVLPQNEKSAIKMIRQTERDPLRIDVPDIFASVDNQALGTLPFDAKLAEENTKAKILPVEDPAAAGKGQKNTASTGETESTAVNTNPAQHTVAEQAIIEEYQSETDEALKGTFESYFNDPKQGFSRHNISTVSERQASDAAKLLGGEYKGYKNAINSNGIQHILNEHGPNGSVDNSLSDLNDIARMGYVLDNYDAVEVVTYESGEADLSREFRTQDNRPAPMLKFSKKVNGTYYVVEAIPESKHKKFWVVSAYMQKADSGTQALDANGPETTPKASLASSLSTSDTNVPQAAPGVNNQYTQDGAQVFAEQAARAPGEMPLDENWRERVADKGLLPGAQLAQQTLQGVEGVADEGYWASIMEEHRAPFSETDVDGYMESLLDAVDQRLNRATPKGTAVTEEYEPANKGKKTKWDNKRPSEIKEVKEIVDDPEVSGSKSITGEFAQALGSDGISYSKDLARNLDAAAGGKNTPLRAKLRDLIERPFNAAAKLYSAMVRSKLDNLKAVTDTLGIKKGSKESAAVQRYGEGQYQDENGEVHEYTEAMLREEFPDTWQNIVKMAQYCRQLYDEFVDRINAVLEKIYPDPVSRAQEDADYHTGKASQYAQMAEEQQRTLNELQRRLGEYKAQLVKTREGTQRYADLQNTIRRIEMQVEGVQKKVDKCRSDADAHNAKAAAVQARIASGEVLRNKRLMKRTDYFHHFNEMAEGWAALENILTTPADINSTLVGVSENTKPKSRWAGFLQGRKGGAYTEDAVGGLLEYIPKAEYKIAFDPIIAENRNIIKTLAQETEETRNANRFILWMTRWTDDLAGKTNFIDRPAQEIFGRKTIATAKWLSSRAKANAVVGNVRSATAQVFNLPNALAYVKSPKAWKSGAAICAKAMAGDQTAKSLFEESGFLNQRYLDDAFSQFDEGLLQKPEKFANWMLAVGDKMSAKLIWATAYEQGRAKGIADPVEYADDITRRSVGGRGVGEVPLAQKAIVTQLFAPFQVEVNNTWQLMKEAGADRNWLGLLAMFAASFLMNSVTRELFGYDVSFDPINAIAEGIQDWDGEETVAGNVLNIAGRVGGEVLSNVPFGSQIATIAINDDYKREQVFGDTDPSRFGTGNIGADALSDTVLSVGDVFSEGDITKFDLMTPLTNFLLPYGGKQVGRLVEGAQDLGLLPGATKEGIARQPDAGSMTDSGGLRFAVDEKNPFDVAKLLALGPFSTKGGMEYLEEGYSALGESQTSAAMEAAKMGVDLVDYMAAYRGMSKAEKDAEKRAVIQNMDLTDEEKAYIYRYAMLNSDAKEKERTVFDSLVGGGSDAGLIGSTLMSMKDAEKQEGKLQSIGAAGVSEQEAKELFGMVMGTDLKTDQGNATAYAKLLDAMNTALGVQEVVELKNAGANFDNFLGYTGAGMDAGSAYDLSMAAVDMRNQEMIEGTFNLKENARWIESANLGKNEQEIAWLITYPEWAEKADKAGVSNWDYITYKKATYGLTKKFDKLKALRDAGYTATEAAQIYDKIN